MALNVNIGIVKKSKRYTRRMSIEGAKTVFSLDPGVALPFDDASVREYLERGTNMNLPTWNNLVVAVLRETVPDFVGANGFYDLERTKLNPKAEVLNNEESKGLDYAHFEGDVFRAWLRVATHSPQKYYPTLNRAAKRPPVILPTIDTVEIEGYVHAPANIQIPDDDDKVYVKDISVPIAQALMSREPIRLRCEDNRLRQGVYFASPIAFIQVHNPTIQQMTEAIAQARAIDEFFGKNMKELQGVAKEVAKAWLIERDSRAIIVSAHRDLENAYRRARTGRCLDLPASPSADAGLRYIDDKIGDLLGEANVQLAPLRPGFKSTLLDYATQEETKGGMSRSFHF